MQMYSEITENSFKFAFSCWISGKELSHKSELTQSDRIPPSKNPAKKINALLMHFCILIHKLIFPYQSFYKKNTHLGHTMGSEYNTADKVIVSSLSYCIPTKCSTLISVFRSLFLALRLQYHSHIAACSRWFFVFSLVNVDAYLPPWRQATRPVCCWDRALQMSLF